MSSHRKNQEGVADSIKQNLPRDLFCIITTASFKCHRTNLTLILFHAKQYIIQLGIIQTTDSYISVIIIKQQSVCHFKCLRAAAKTHRVRNEYRCKATLGERVSAKVQNKSRHSFPSNHAALVWGSTNTLIHKVTEAEHEPSANDTVSPVKHWGLGCLQPRRYRTVTINSTEQASEMLLSARPWLDPPL